MNVVYIISIFLNQISTENHSKYFCLLIFDYSVNGTKYSLTDIEKKNIFKMKLIFIKVEF